MLNLDSKEIVWDFDDSRVVFTPIPHNLEIGYKGEEPEYLPKLKEVCERLTIKMYLK